MGALLAPQASCSVEVIYVPQPNTSLNSGLDYFLELNTVQCTNAVNEPRLRPTAKSTADVFRWS